MNLPLKAWTSGVVSISTFWKCVYVPRGTLLSFNMMIATIVFFSLGGSASLLLLFLRLEFNRPFLSGCFSFLSWWKQNPIYTYYQSGCCIQVIRAHIVRLIRASESRRSMTLSVPLYKIRPKTLIRAWVIYRLRALCIVQCRWAVNRLTARARAGHLFM